MGLSQALLYFNFQQSTMCPGLTAYALFLVLKLQELLMG